MAFLLLCDPGWCVHILTERRSLTSRINGRNMVIIYSKRIDQPGRGVNPARGQLNLSPFTPENLVLRDRFGRPVPRHPAHSPHSG